MRTLRESISALLPLRVRIPLFLSLFLLVNTLKLVGFRIILSSSEPTTLVLAILTVETLAVLLILHVFFWSGRRRLPFILFYFAQTVYVTLNLLYFLSMKDYLRPDEITVLAEQAVFVLPYCSADINPLYLLLFADLPLFLAVLLLPTPALRIYRRDRQRLAWLLLAALLIGLPVTYHSYCQRSQLHPWDDDSEPKNPEEVYIQQHGLLPLTIFDSLSTRRNLRKMELRSSRRTISFLPNEQKQNIVMIQVEAMGARIVGQFHKNRYVMPYLHHLSLQSIYYPFMMSYHKGGGTSDCDFTVLNSIEPLNYSSVFFDAKYTYPNSVLKVLRAAGYGTYAFHGNTGQCWNRRESFAKMGYQIFYDQETMMLPSAGWGAPDKAVFDYVLETLPKKRRPFFAHVITMSSHFPYNSVDQYYTDERFSDIPAKEARSYFNSMSYVDKALEEFVEKLRKMDNTTIIIYGDHAASRMVGKYFTAAKFSIRTNVLEFVPCVIITPTATAYRERNRVPTFLDMAPTILDIAGIGCTYATSGQSLLQTPIEDSQIPLRGSLYLRSYLMQKCRTVDWSNVWRVQGSGQDSASSSSRSSMGSGSASRSAP